MPDTSLLEPVILGVCAINLAFMAAWLTVGALENLFHPFLNETFTAQVMDMQRMRDEYPEAYALVAYRRIESPVVRRALFRLVLGWELLAALALWGAAAAVVLAAFGAVAAGPALAAGLVAATLFTAVWAGFLIIGNYFCYWFGHEGGQNTHFHMLHWGMAGGMLMVLAAVALGAI
ncbi:DUF2165 family protein [Sulfitobacter sp. D35]|uniref:DUF2165 family protein n=1 Tax=Sulfitobacter sp. D35 TaxID=3083252 RepID=UPI00296E4775|nr:DUF2165 family protein [Sulfitobacter sp. D35]MDW4500041.1 DUF2165 family protein [Sulfitobacter sp. D35]